MEHTHCNPIYLRVIRPIVVVVDCFLSDCKHGLDGGVIFTIGGCSGNVLVDVVHSGDY
jgi:hypothetical protein